MSTAALSGKRQRPNIVFMMSDDHAVPAFSCYGNKSIQTPHLDRLAREGLLFRNSFVTNAVCGPSRAAILTGTYNHINGFKDNSSTFDQSQVTYPRLLREAGYQTAMIGKWHLGSTPEGFDYYSILPNQGHYYQPEFIENGATVTEPGYVTDVVTDKALRYLDSRDRERPFLLIYQQKAPHRNWLPAPRHLGMYDDVTFPEPPNLHDDLTHRGQAAREQEMNIATDMWDAWDLKLVSRQALDEIAVQSTAQTFGDSKEQDAELANLRERDRARFFEVFDRMTPEEKDAWGRVYDRRVAEFEKLNLTGRELVSWKYQQYMRDYYACVASIDENVGRLLAYLEEEDELDNTIIVYTSDHGFFLGEHGFFDKRFMYEESIRVPLLIRYPQAIPAGSASEALTLNIDFSATFLDYAGVSIPPHFQGASLRPILEDTGHTPQEWRDSIYYHYYEYPSWHSVKRHYGIRTERHKLIHFYNDIDEWELYDLLLDPHEMRNLANDSAYTEVLSELRTRLRHLQERLHDTEGLSLHAHAA